MTTLATNLPSTAQPKSRRSASIIHRATRLFMRAMVFLSLGAIVSVLMAWALGMWGEPQSATVVSSTVPQRGRTWNISSWSSSGSLRLQCQPQVHAWSAWQATGAPDAVLGGDSSMAWCPATADGQKEWLILDYPQPMTPKFVDVYENYCGGMVTRVTVFKENGDEVDAWRGQDPIPAVLGSCGVATIPLDVSFKTQRIKLYLDSPAAVGWNEVDAVGLIDAEGNKQWACDVQESSSYADLNVAAVSPLTLKDIVPSWCPIAQADAAKAKLSANGDRNFEARGWPMLALWSERSTTPAASGAATGARPSGRSMSPRIIPLANPASGLTPLLPTRPIWSGLLFDTAFYAAFLAAGFWLLVRPRRMVIELLRMRRGCCIACGYELDFDFRAGCPECGWRRSHH